MESKEVKRFKKLKYADRVKIEELLKKDWQQLGKTIVLAVNEKGESVKYEVSLESKEVKRCSN